MVNRFSVKVRIHQFAVAAVKPWVDICYTLSPDQSAVQIFLFPPCQAFFKKVPAATSAHIDQTENNVARAISTGRVMIYQSAIYGAAISPISNELFLHPPPAADWEIWLRSANESKIYNGISRVSR